MLCYVLSPSEGLTDTEGDDETTSATCLASENDFNDPAVVGTLGLSHFDIHD